MKFLFDQSADFRLIDHLRSLGHDVTAVSRNYPHSLADEDVLELARKEQRILVVADRDFGELIFHQGLAPAGVLFFRLPGESLQTKIDHLDQALQDHADKLAAGEFVVVAPGNIRVAGRPGSYIACAGTSFSIV
jgi:predicted nuclease of predicted toxin-antitoxin system